MLETIEMRKVYGDTMIELAAKNEKIVSLQADLTGANGMKEFHARYPERSFNVGIAEADASVLTVSPNPADGRCVVSLDDGCLPS